MASKIMYLYSNEGSAETQLEYSNGSFSEKKGEFNFDLSGIDSNKTITGMNIQAPITGSTALWCTGSYWDTLLLDSVQIASGSGTGNISLSTTGLSKVSPKSAKVSITPGISVESGKTYALYSASFGRATATITYTIDVKPVQVSPIDTTIARSKDNTFTWTTGSESLAGATLYWRKQGETAWNNVTSSTDHLSATVPANTLPIGTIEWYVTITESDGNTENSNVLTCACGSVPSVAIAYPSDSNIKNGIKQIFTWELTDSLDTGQIAYEIGYKLKTETEYTTITAASANQYHEFAADTFTTAEYDWRVRLINGDGITSAFAYASFKAIGATDAPVITGVTNSSIPTVTWTIESQDTFEFEMYKGEERIYTSGVQVGADIRTFTPNIILENGNYIIKIRAMNEYGYFTEWMTYSFVLNPTAPAAYTCYAYTNSRYGVDISRSLELDKVSPTEPPTQTELAPDAIYVLRREYGETEWQILGKLSTTDETVIFTDNTPQTNLKYEYALRNYASGAGYKDSESVVISIHHSGSIIYKDNEAVNLYKTEDIQPQISHTPGKDYTYTHMIGREYPVRESSDWMTHTVSMDCFVAYEEYKQLHAMFAGDNKLFFKQAGFAFPCAIDAMPITATLLGMGYTVSLTVSRVDEEEVQLF